MFQGNRTLTGSEMRFKTCVQIKPWWKSLRPKHVGKKNLINKFKQTSSWISYCVITRSIEGTTLHSPHTYAQEYSNLDGLFVEIFKNKNASLVDMKAGRHMKSIVNTYFDFICTWWTGRQVGTLKVLLIQISTCTCSAGKQVDR